MSEVRIERDVLEDQDRVAAENRERLRQAGVYCVNLMSAPGAGKTTLLERTISALSREVRIGVIAGDIETRRDADRIERHGVPVVQVNTGGACHLDARMVGPALDKIDLQSLDILVIENVGNLVCPAEFDVGEHDKVMILSVTEGHDKPAKYPLMFYKSRLMLLGKVDLLPYVDFDCEAAIRDARALNPDIEVIRISSKTGEGLDDWFAWLRRRLRACKGK